LTDFGKTPKSAATDLGKISERRVKDASKDAGKTPRKTIEKAHADRFVRVSSLLFFAIIILSQIPTDFY